MSTLTVVRDGNGGGLVTSTPTGIDCGSDCTETVVAGSTITLTAAADASSELIGWSGGGCAGTDPCTVTVGSDLTVTATFAMKNTLMVTVVGAGSVVSNPGGIDCGSDCAELFSADQSVTLTATPDESTHFVGFSGACTGMTCTVTMDQARAVTATFEINHYTLTASKSGSGAGSVTSSPAGIDCGADCDEDYDHGTLVTLTAAPSAGSLFIGWTGGGCTGTSTCEVAVTAATEVTANFMITQENVTVMKSGNGAGRVTSSPAGIDCGTDCDERFDYGTLVTLSASPSIGSTFTGWSGACTGTGPCIVTVTAATAVAATFTLTRHALTVTRSGSGAGSVTSTPAGIDCGADCTQLFDYGTDVTLTAVPAAGTTFTGWSGGGCAGVGLCVVDVTAAATVNATFTINSYVLTVTRAGAGTGTVTSSPAGINCGADCSETYDHGSVITLTAVATNGASFAGWSGAGCTGTGSCTVTMTLARAVTATFAACGGSSSFDATGALQSFTVPACASTVTIDAYGAAGGSSFGEDLLQNFAGGRGARARGTFSVAGGQVLSVLVGRRGDDTPEAGTCGAGGGGGSFVVLNSQPLVVAAGGGGGFHCHYYGGANGGGGGVTTSGASGIAAPGGTGGIPSGCYAGGTGGGGGRAFFGGGGGGFTGAGISDTKSDGGGGAYPGAGGSIGGGYGGGGGRFDYCCGGAGGGGGYSGGGGSSLDGCAGGGGGSFNAGTGQTMTAATRSGDGVVTISWN